MKLPAKSADESRENTQLRRPRGAEVLAAIFLTLARLFFAVALILALLASYSIWGGPGSVLGELWKAAAAVAMLWIASLVLHRTMLNRIYTYRAMRRPDRTGRSDDNGRFDSE